MHKKQGMGQNVDLLRELGYEPRDIALGTLAKWIAFVFIFFAAMAGVAWGIYALFVKQEVTDTASISSSMRRMPADPYPIIQPLPIRDIGEYRDQEDARLNGYVWKDKATGVLAIPVDRAKELILQRGMPARAAAPADLRPASSSLVPVPSSQPADTGRPAAGGPSANSASGHSETAAPAAQPTIPAAAPTQPIAPPNPNVQTAPPTGTR